MSLKKDLSKYKPRKEQKEALNFIDSQYNADPLKKFFLLNLPKTYINLIFCKYLQNFYN